MEDVGLPKVGGFDVVDKTGSMIRSHHTQGRLRDNTCPGLCFGKTLCHNRALSALLIK